jgi:hypothetical protein
MLYSFVGKGAINLQKRGNFFVANFNQILAKNNFFEQKMNKIAIFGTQKSQKAIF